MINPLANSRGNSIFQNCEIINSISNSIFTEKIKNSIDNVLKKRSKNKMSVTHFYYSKEDVFGPGKIGESVIKLAANYIEKQYDTVPDIMGSIIVNCGCCDKEFEVGMFGTFIKKEKTFIIVLNTELREINTSVRFYQLDNFIEMKLYQGRIGGNQSKKNIKKIRPPVNIEPELTPITL
jgi:hypothetical protein